MTTLDASPPWSCSAALRCIPKVPASTKLGLSTCTWNSKGQLHSVGGLTGRAFGKQVFRHPKAVTHFQTQLLQISDHLPNQVQALRTALKPRALTIRHSPVLPHVGPDQRGCCAPCISSWSPVALVKADGVCRECRIVAQSCRIARLGAPCSAPAQPATLPDSPVRIPHGFSLRSLALPSTCRALRFEVYLAGGRAIDLEKDVI